MTTSSLIVVGAPHTIVIIGLVPMIHDFAARSQSRGWSASADHDVLGFAAVRA